MELPKRICEACHKEGKVIEADFRIVRKEVGGVSLLDTKEWELCEKHLLQTSISRFLNDSERPTTKQTIVTWNFGSLKIKRLSYWPTRM